MRPFKIILTALAALTISLSSCSNEDLSLYDENPSKSDISELRGRRDIPDSIKVNQEEIFSVINTFKSKNPYSRNNSMDYEITPVNNSNGDPIYYVVNFSNNEGFVLISATKKMLPVIAYSDKGSFQIGDTGNTPLETWKQGIEAEFENVERLPLDSVLTAVASWRKYESSPLSLNDGESDKTDFPPGAGGDMLRQMKQELIAQAIDDHAQTLYYPYDDFGPEGFNSQDFWDSMRGWVPPQYEDYWRLLCFVAEIPYVEEEFVDNFVYTNWHQGNPYNLKCPIINDQPCVAGCVPIAIAQLMNYYQYPSTKNWEAIGEGDSWLNNYPLYNFIKEIGDECNADYGVDETTVLFDKIIPFFRSNGYYAESSTFMSTAKDLIKSQKPVIITSDVDSYTPQGTTLLNNGHAWLGTGYKFKQGFKKYILYFINSNCNKATDEIAPREYDNVQYHAWYMNWGQSQAINGWYYWSKSQNYNDEHISFIVRGNTKYILATPNN